jgi:hypothetical protein
MQYTVNTLCKRNGFCNICFFIKEIKKYKHHLSALPPKKKYKTEKENVVIFLIFRKKTYIFAKISSKLKLAIILHVY